MASPWREISSKPPTVVTGEEQPPHGVTATQVLYWNLRGEHEPLRPWSHVVESEQWGHGYIIGTRGAVHGVQLPRQAGLLTDPIDHVEGIGQGDFIDPQSLYEDQLENRLSTR